MVELKQPKATRHCRWKVRKWNLNLKEWRKHALYRSRPSLNWRVCSRDLRRREAKQSADTCVVSPTAYRCPISVWVSPWLSQADEVEKLRKALSDESELLKATQTTVKTQRTDIDNLKSLLASREADHRRDIENRYLIDSPKLEQLFESKVTSLVREHAAGRREVEYR